MNFEKPASPTPEQMKTEKETPLRSQEDIYREPLVEQSTPAVDYEALQTEYDSTVTEMEAKLGPLSDEVKQELHQNMVRDVPRVNEMEDAKEFSKIYSPRERSLLARKIRNMRAKYFKQEKKAKQINEERQPKREDAEAKLEALKAEAAEVYEKLDELDAAMSKRKFEVFGMVIDFTSQKTKKEWEIYDALRQQVNEEMAKKKQILASVEEVVVEDTLLRESRSELTNFYRKQEEIKNIYESEDDLRNVEKVSRERNLVFFHAMSLEDYRALGVVENNQMVNADRLDNEIRISLLIGLNPTISVSTKRLDRSRTKEDMTFYPAGVLLKGGRIMSAYSGDGLTQVHSIFAKQAANDKTLKSSVVHENFRQRLDAAITKTTSEEEYGINKEAPYNELIVENPEIAALAINLDHETLKISPKRIASIGAELERLSIEFGMPVYGIREGKILDMKNGEQEVSLDSVLDFGIQKSTEERLGMVREAVEQGVLTSGGVREYLEAYYVGVNVMNPDTFSALSYSLRDLIGYERNFEKIIERARGTIDYLEQSIRLNEQQESSESNGTKNQTEKYKKLLKEATFLLYGLSQTSEVKNNTTLSVDMTAVIDQSFGVEQCRNFIETHRQNDKKLCLLLEDFPPDIQKRMRELGAKDDDTFDF